VVHCQVDNLSKLFSEMNKLDKNEKNSVEKKHKVSLVHQNFYKTLVRRE